MTPNGRPWRSLLFAAADDAKRLAKIGERGADAVILDLEDAVPAERKGAARAALPASVELLPGSNIVVRINAAWRDVHADLAVAVRIGVAAIMVPKVEDAGRLAVIGEMIAEYAHTAGMSAIPGMIALVEGPAGIAQLGGIAAVDGVCGLALGSEDFSLALGVPPTPEALDLPCRMIALAAAARQQMALGLPLSITTIADTAAWEGAVHKARAIGMTGALCIHPGQIGPVNRGFSSSVQEREGAARIIAAWEAADAPGVIMVDGRMIDKPVIEAMRKLLAARYDR